MTELTAEESKASFLFVKGAGDEYVNGMYTIQSKELREDGFVYTKLFGKKKCSIKKAKGGYGTMCWWIYNDSNYQYCYCSTVLNSKIPPTKGWNKANTGTLPVPDVYLVSEQDLIKNAMANINVTKKRKCPFNEEEGARPIILKIKNADKIFYIHTTENVAVLCGDTLKSLITGDSETNEYQLTLPCLVCIDFLWVFLRIGELQRIEFTPEKLLSLIQCADYLQSDYLMELCAKEMRDLESAKETSSLKDFNPDTVPSHVLEKLIGTHNLKGDSKWSPILKNWCEGISGVYRLFQYTLDHVSN